MKKLIVMVVLVCLSVVTFSEENGCGPTDSDKTKQTIPIKNTKKEKKVKKQVQKKDDKNTKNTNKTSGTCKIK